MEKCKIIIEFNSKKSIEVIKNELTNSLDTNFYRLKSASFFLCNDNIEEALRLLDNAINNNSDEIPDEIIVWEKFQNEDLDSLIQLIDNMAELFRPIYLQSTKNVTIETF